LSKLINEDDEIICEILKIQYISEIAYRDYDWLEEERDLP
jgi:hypothetical protein